MSKVPASTVVTALEGSESPLPAEIQEALGELVGAAREGLLALSVGVGLGVVHELMALEVDEVVGPTRVRQFGADFSRLRRRFWLARAERLVERVEFPR